LLLPNGQVLTADGETLIVAESAGQRLTAITLTPEGSSPTVVSGTNATARLARFLLGHRRLVLLLWALLLPAGIYGAGHVSKRLKVDFSLPGTSELSEEPWLDAHLDHRRRAAR
jgi:hypothetical protein